MNLVDKITDEINVYHDNISIIYHAVPYDDGNPFFIMFHNELRAAWYGLAIGDFDNDFSITSVNYRV